MHRNKALKEAYKQKTFPMGVFQIKCTATDKVFIDHSTDMEARWNRHKMELKYKSHRNKALQKDWNNYGESSFEFEVLSELKKEEQDEFVNYRKELKDLQEMVLEELRITNRY